ncbi:MAG: hypothetical protein AAGF23_24880 [Acidobacteriota bacterium]
MEELDGHLAVQGRVFVPRSVDDPHAALAEPAFESVGAHPPAVGRELAGRLRRQPRRMLEDRVGALGRADQAFDPLRQRGVAGAGLAQADRAFVRGASTTRWKTDSTRRQRSGVTGLRPL